MKTVLRNSLVSCAALFVLSTSVHADINTSLQTVCSNAKSAVNQTVDKKIKQVQGDYRAKLANYYKGVSCNGKSLLTLSSNSLDQSAGTLIERKILK